jgi:hypothetical protein
MSARPRANDKNWVKEQFISSQAFHRTHGERVQKNLELFDPIDQKQHRLQPATIQIIIQRELEKPQSINRLVETTQESQRLLGRTCSRIKAGTLETSRRAYNTEGNRYLTTALMGSLRGGRKASWCARTEGSRRRWKTNNGSRSRANTRPTNATETDPSGALMLVGAHTEGCPKTQQESENQQSRPQENTENTGAEVNCAGRTMLSSRPDRKPGRSRNLTSKARNWDSKYC